MPIARTAHSTYRRNSMSKKQDFLRDQQNRDARPQSGMAGSASAVDEEQWRKTPHGIDPEDRQEPQSGKVGNDHNKVGDTRPTQTNQGRRTPQSRHDRQSIGSGPMN